MDIETHKTALAEERAALEKELARVTKRQNRLEKASEQFDAQPEVGSVIKFDRTIAGYARKYTFVAHRSPVGWYVTGSRNGLRVLGLREKENSWSDLLVAIGDNEAFVASGWAPARGIGRTFTNSRDAQEAGLPAGTVLQDSDGDTLEVQQNGRFQYLTVFGSPETDHNPWDGCDDSRSYGPYTVVEQA